MCVGGRDLGSTDWELPWKPDAPALAREVLERLERGPGFVVVQGLPTHELHPEEAERFALTVVEGFGEPLEQHADGRMTWLVRDEGHTLVATGENGPAYVKGTKSSKSAGELELHNDSAAGWFGHEVDFLALLVVRQAPTGGDTRLVNARRVYDILTKERPELAEQLGRPFSFDRSTGHHHWQQPYSEGPVFDVRDGLFTARCNRPRIELVQEMTRRPLTERQICALDALKEVMGRPELRVSLRLQEGECLLLKVLEALSRGRAVVTTSVGSQGLGDLPAAALIVRDDVSSIARACLRLLASTEARRSQEQRARDAARLLPTWDQAAEALARVWDSRASVAHRPDLAVAPG